jgi:hypothetical protein
VEEIEEFKAEQQTRFGEQWCSGERARARRSRGGNGGSVSPLERGESERGDRGASEGERQLCGALEDLVSWWVGPRPAYGRHRASTRRPRSEAGRPPRL